MSAIPEDVSTSVASASEVRISYARGTRALWVVLAVACFCFGGAMMYGLTSVHLAFPWGVLALLATGGLYLWVGSGAVALATARRAFVRIENDRLTIAHDGLLLRPIVVERDGVDGANVDLRRARDRRIAAATRAGGVAPSNFIDPNVPVVSVSPTAHWRRGALSVPNVILFFHAPVYAPHVPLSVRALLRVAIGRFGRYYGPRPGHPMSMLRLAVDDPVALAEAFERWGVLETEARDLMYLSPIRSRNVARYRRERWIMAAIVAAVFLVTVARALAGNG